MEITQQQYQVRDVTLHVAVAGPAAGEVVLFLHGFPEFWYGWRKQLLYFAAHGYRAVAPDQRGYNHSSKPPNVRAYRLEELVADVAALIRQLTPGKAYLVGHDWGGAVAWAVARQHPELLHRLLILNMPHPQVMKRHVRHSMRQLLRSWYVGFFQLPWLPERFAGAFNFALLAHTLRTSSRAGTFSEEELNYYKTAWGQPRALRSMIHWYRAYKYSRLRLSGEIIVPTLLVWGRKDRFLGQEMAQPSIERCRDGQLVFLDEATHWLHHEQPDEVNRLLHAFIRDDAAQLRR